MSSDIPSLRETTSPDSALLVDPNDVDAIASAIRVLVEDTDRRKAMAKAALAWATRSSIEDRGRRILDWLAEVEAGPYPRRQA